MTHDGLGYEAVLAVWNVGSRIDDEEDKRHSA